MIAERQQDRFHRPSAIVGGAQEIWAIDLNGTNLQQLTQRPAGEVGPGGNSLVTWAPDSQSIAYGYTVQDPNHPVVDKHTTIQVTNLVTNQTIPDLTGPYLCPGVGVCRQNVDAKGNVIPGQFVLDANSPAWSPTGNEIAYAAGLEGSGVQIWKIDANGNKRKLTFPEVPPSTPVPPFLPPLFDANPYPTNDDPAWSPDGTKILYTSFPTYLPIPDAPFFGVIPGIWVMDADGSNPHFLVQNTFGPLPGRAAWQPVLVPEPASMALLGGALFGFGLTRRRNRTRTV